MTAVVSRGRQAGHRAGLVRFRGGTAFATRELAEER